MSKVNKVPKKLRDGPVIMIDNQILLRRKRLKEKGIILGRASEYREKVNKEAREERALPPPEKRRWF